MISVLIPSRGRPDSLAASILSMRDLAAGPDGLEFLVAVDPDDTVTLGALPPARIWTAPERYGYTGLHRYYNHLASMATGDWLMVWNDDARMLTPSWDAVIGWQPPAVLWPQANHSPHACTFPVWPRAWTVATGHVSLSPHCDTWMQRTGEQTAMLRIPVSVLHDRYDVTGSHGDQTYAEGRALLGPEGMADDFAAHYPQIQKDAEIIRGLLNGGNGT